MRLSIVLYCEKLLEIWFTGDYFRFSCILMLAGSNEIFQTLKILSPTKKPNPHAFGSNGYARFAFQPVGFRVNLLPLRCLALFFAFSLFFVIKFTLGHAALNDSVAMWRNTSDLPTESHSGAGFSVSAITLADKMDTVHFSRFTAGTTFFDEVRIVDSWTMVTPVPEPSTWALRGSSALALSAFHQKTSLSHTADRV